MFSRDPEGSACPRPHCRCTWPVRVAPDRVTTDEGPAELAVWALPVAAGRAGLRFGSQPAGRPEKNLNYVAIGSGLR